MRPSTLPTINSSHHFAANLQHAWTFHATGNTGAANADDIPGVRDATLSGATLSDSLGLVCNVTTDRVAISEKAFTLPGNPTSIVWRSSCAAANSESMVAGRTTDGNHFIWSYNSGNVQVRVGAVDYVFSGGSGGIALTDYCLVFSGTSPNYTISLFTKPASGSSWSQIGTAKTASGTSFYIDSIGAGFNASQLWLKGKLEYFYILNAALSVTNLNANFSDPYAILSAMAGPLTAGSASVVSVGDTVASVTCGSVSGGTGPYTYQWQRSTTSSSGFANISGATTTSLSDTGLTNGTTYYYRLVSTDGVAASVTSNEIAATPTNNIVLVCEGDSLTQGTGSIGGNTYPAQLDAIVGATYVTTNLGQGGSRIANLVSRAAAADAYYNSGASVNHFIAWAGTNDLIDGTSGSSALSAFNAYCLARRNAGWKVYVLPILPRTAAGTPGGFEAQRQIFNASLRSTFTSFANVLIDIDNEQYLSDPANATYYADLCHLTNAGYQVVAYRAKVEINGANGGQE